MRTCVVVFHPLTPTAEVGGLSAAVGSAVSVILPVDLTLCHTSRTHRLDF